MKFLLLLSALFLQLNVAKADTSASLRANKTVGFHVAFLGYEYVALNVLSVGGSYYLDGDNYLFARYSNFNGSHESGNSETLRATTVGLKHFFNNSFNITPTVYYRRNTKEGDYSLFTNAKGKLMYEDVGVGVRIGNEWQWKNFYMGADWFGINQTVKKFHEDKTAGSWDDFELERKITFTLASFYLGFSF